MYSVYIFQIHIAQIYIKLVYKATFSFTLEPWILSVAYFEPKKIEKKNTVRVSL